MNANIFLLILAIYWSNIAVQSNGDDDVPVEPVEINYNTFQAITSRLYHARSFQVYSLDQSTAYFKYSVVHKNKSTSIEPEICEWGATENETAAQELCRNTAIKLATEVTPLMQPSQQNLGIKGLIPYKKCYTRREKSENVDVNGIYCPPLIVEVPTYGDPPNESQRVFMDGFLLGEGDREINSAFVYHFDHKNVHSVRLVRYVFKLFITPAIYIQNNTYNAMVSQLNDMQFVLHYDEAKAVNRFKFFNNPCGHLQLCSKLADQSALSDSSEEVTRTLCKYFATLLFSSLGKYHENVNLIYTDEDSRSGNHPDISGFVPYKYVNRKVNHKLLPLIGPKSEQKMVYCPVQLFSIEEDRWHRQQGFFYSAGDGNENSAFLYYMKMSVVDGQTTFEHIHVKSYVTWSNLDHMVARDEE